MWLGKSHCWLDASCSWQVESPCKLPFYKLFMPILNKCLDAKTLLSIWNRLWYWISPRLLPVSITSPKNGWYSFNPMTWQNSSVPHAHRWVSLSCSGYKQIDDRSKLKFNFTLFLANVENLYHGTRWNNFLSHWSLGRHLVKRNRPKKCSVTRYILQFEKNTEYKST